MRDDETGSLSRLARLLYRVLPGVAAAPLGGHEAAMAGAPAGMRSGDPGRPDGFVMELPNRIDGPDQFAAHSSHRSHRSHSSHYSGSGGGYSAPRTYTPPPSYVAPSPSTPQQAPASPAPRSGSSGSTGARSAPGAVPGCASTEGLIVAMRAQVELRARGFYNGPVDGIMSSGTASALRQFQQSRLPQSGVLDNATLAALGINCR